VWRLVKWSRTKAQLPTELPVMPVLQSTQGLVYSINEKTEVLKARFYPVVEADLNNIQDTAFKEESFQNTCLDIPK